LRHVGGTKQSVYLTYLSRTTDHRDRFFGACPIDLVELLRRWQRDQGTFRHLRMRLLRIEQGRRFAIVMDDVDIGLIFGDHIHPQEITRFDGLRGLCWRAALPGADLYSYLGPYALLRCHWRRQLRVQPYSQAYGYPKIRARHRAVHSVLLRRAISRAPRARAGLVEHGHAA